MVVEKLYYTIVDEKTGEEERVNIDIKHDNDDQKVALNFPAVAPIGRQQLAELGWLLLALAGDNVDHSSGLELIDGYGIAVPQSWYTNGLAAVLENS